MRASASSVALMNHSRSTYNELNKEKIGEQNVSKLQS